MQNVGASPYTIMTDRVHDKGYMIEKYRHTNRTNSKLSKTNMATQRRQKENCMHLLTVPGKSGAPEQRKFSATNWKRNIRLIYDILYLGFVAPYSRRRNDD